MKAPQSVDGRASSAEQWRVILKGLLPFFQPYRWQALFVLVLVFSFAWLGRLGALIFGWAVDHGIKEKSVQVVLWGAVAFFLLEITLALLAFLQNYQMQRLGNRVLFQLRSRLIDRLLQLPMRYFDKTSVGRIVTRATNDVGSLGDLFSEGFTAIFVNIVELVFIVGVMTWVSPPLGLIAALMIPLSLWMTSGLSRRLRHLFYESKKSMANINGFTAETISGMNVLQLFNRTQASREKFQTLSEDYRKVQMQTVHVYAALWPLLSLGHLVSLLAVLTAGGWVVHTGHLTIGQLSSETLLVGSFYHPLRMILERYSQLQNSLASALRIMEIFEEPVEGPEPQGAARHDNTAATQSVQEQRLRGEIRIDRLVFRYSPDANPALADFSLTIAPGEKIAIVGRTGSGKSTLVALLQKFYPYQQGEIWLDGTPLRDLDAGFVRRRIGVIRQDPHLFRGTLRDNVRLLSPELSDSVLLSALDRAQCEALLRRLPDGLDSPIEERGHNLSMGERQLISFARLLAHDPDILILDEATAHIDSVSEARIQAALAELIRGRTSLVVAHRLSTVKNCDRIIVLEKGRIIEVGSPNELLKKKGRYAELWARQFGLEAQPLSGVPERTDLFPGERGS